MMHGPAWGNGRQPGILGVIKKKTGKKRPNGAKQSDSTYLNPCLQSQESIAGIAHFEYTAKSVFGEVANLENLQVGRHSAQVELAHEDIVDDDGRLGGFVQGRCEQITGSTVEFSVRSKRRPVEVEGHVEMAMAVSQSCGREMRGAKPKPVAAVSAKDQARGDAWVVRGSPLGLLEYDDIWAGIQGR